MEIVRIDRIALDFGMPMGPIELIDEIGIDVGYKVAKILEDAYGPRMKAASILAKAKEKGLLGKKKGAGFYMHKPKGKSPNPDIYRLIAKNPAKEIRDEQALKRMIYVMINEASRCLEEGVADRPATIDIGMIMGTGFPPFRAGLLRYADSVGINNIIKDLKSFEGERFRPCAYLIKLQETQKGFYSSTVPF